MAGGTYLMISSMQYDKMDDASSVSGSLVWTLS